MPPMHLQGVLCILYHSFYNTRKVRVENPGKRKSFGVSMAENTGKSSVHTAAGASVSVRSRAFGSIPNTLEALNSRLTDERRQALNEAVTSFRDGSVVRPHDTGWVNVLARTFFSYSYDSFSPARLAWEAVIRGLSVIGSADYGNLGALGELQLAGDALGIRATVSMETKVYVPAYADREINCPDQPGFLRCLGVGFTNVPSLNCESGNLIASLPGQSRDRNKARIARFNPILNPVCIDYDENVIPLTPAGNATPEHLAAAYALKAMELFPDRNDRAVFWADVMGRPPQEVEELLDDEASFRDVLWEKLTRFSPDTPQPEEYPNIDNFFDAVREAGAIPCLYWLGGFTDGEADSSRLLDDAVNWGVRAVAIAPDSCWNIVANPEEKESRLGAMANFIAQARKHNLPILAGSPMSKAKQKFVDSFDAPELAPYFRDFTDGAFWLYGHATLERASGLGAMSEWAGHVFGRDRAARNAFYLQVGKKAFPGKATRVRIASLGAEPDPGDILDALVPLKI